MLVRTQDKETLIDITGKRLNIFKNRDDYYEINIIEPLETNITYTTAVPLGCYPTEEKAQQVLNDIEVAWSQWTPGSPAYYMPDENSVVDMSDVEIAKTMQKNTESVVKQFFKEHPDEAGKSANTGKKETTIDDVTEYLNGMIKECRTFCEKHHCNRCKINEHNSKMCSLLSILEDDDTEVMLKYADKIIKSGDFEIYPNPSDTVLFFIQTKIEAAGSEFEKKEYLEILKHLQEE